MLARATLNRPDTRNALDAELSTRLAEGVGAALEDERVRVVVLDHEGSVFSAGANLRAAGQHDMQPYIDPSLCGIHPSRRSRPN